MAWLLGWNRRKSKTVNGNAAGSQTDYQLKLIVHKGTGIDTNTDIYLGTNVRNDFGDVRFTASGDSTLLSYWIESYISGSIATIWIKIPSIPASPSSTMIYIYYDNSTQIATSNGDNTFILFDTTGLTEVDPDSKISITSNTITWSSLNPVALPIRDYTYKSIESISEYIFDFEFQLTSGGSSHENDAHMIAACLGDGAGSVCSSPNYLGAYLYYAPHCCGANLSLNERTSGVFSVSGGIVISAGTTYYCRITNTGTSVILNIFSDAARTINITGSPTSKSRNIVTYSYAIPMSQSTSAGSACDTSNYYYNKNAGWSSGFIRNMRLRKYTSPEPSFGTTGSEETFQIFLLFNPITIAGD